MFTMVGVLFLETPPPMHLSTVYTHLGWGSIQLTLPRRMSKLSENNLWSIKCPLSLNPPPKNG